MEKALKEIWEQEREVLWNKLKQRGRQANDYIWPLNIRLLPFLDFEESYWIAQLNRRDFFSEAPELQKEMDFILKLLHRYLDALEKEPEERQSALDKIASEIDRGINLDGGRRSFRTNPAFSPEADRKDPAQMYRARAFIITNAGKLAGIYESLARFLSSPYVHRLKRCKYCKGLFIALDDRRREYCQGTDHKRLSEKQEYGAEYHKKDMKQRRDPDSCKFDKKYL
ncbi:MAG: hypothetical protein O2954_12940 [bacterium]|nr:hypothetical protein [bacterium]